MFARRLRVLRKLRAISQAELAKRAGVAQSTIFEIENVDESGIEFLIRKAELVARVLGYEFWQLILPINDRLDLDDPESFGVSDLRRSINRLTSLVNCYSELKEEDQQKVNSFAKELSNLQPDLKFLRNK